MFGTSAQSSLGITICHFKSSAFSSWWRRLVWCFCANASLASMITLGDYLMVSGILFAFGFAGVMLRRNLIIIFMSLELMLNAANLSLVAFSRFRVGPTGLPDYNAQVFVFFIITVAAAEVAVGLAILVALYRARQTTDVKDITSLKF